MADPRNREKQPGLQSTQPNMCSAAFCSQWPIAYSNFWYHTMGPERQCLPEGVTREEYHQTCLSALMNIYVQLSAVLRSSGSRYSSRRSTVIKFRADAVSVCQDGACLFSHSSSSSPAVLCRRYAGATQLPHHVWLSLNLKEKFAAPEMRQNCISFAKKHFQSYIFRVNFSSTLPKIWLPTESFNQTGKLILLWNGLKLKKSSTV